MTFYKTLITLLLILYGNHEQGNGDTRRIGDHPYTTSAMNEVREYKVAGMKSI